MSENAHERHVRLAEELLAEAAALAEGGHAIYRRYQVIKVILQRAQVHAELAAATSWMRHREETS